MTTGVFNIHPKNGATINVDFSGGTGPYFVSDSLLDWNESERLSILYNDGAIGGTVIGSSAGLVTSLVRIIVAGNTKDEISASARTLTRAFSDNDGGYIEYKPLEYPDATIHTYYKYIRSKYPSILEPKVGVTAEYKLGVLYEFEVQTFAWATSDPDSPVNIFTDEASTNSSPSFSIASSSLKGDVSFPILEIAGSAGTHAQDEIVLHFLDVGSDDLDHDVYEAPAQHAANFTLSGDDYNNDNSFTSGYVTWTIGLVHTNMTRKYIGRVAPMVFANYTISGQPIRLKMQTTIQAPSSEGSAVDITYSVVHPLNIADTPVQTVLRSFNLPVVGMPENVDDVDISGAMSTHHIRLHVEYTGVTPLSSGRYVIDRIFLFPVEYPNWLSVFTSDIDEFAFSITSTQPLVIDAFRGIHYKKDKTGDIALRPPPANSGMPVSSLILLSDRTYRVLSLGRVKSTHSTEKGYTYASSNGRDITIDVVFGTIYPFDES